MSLPAEQAEVAAMLRELAGADPVETHISAVFLGEDTVFKLRKAVRLSFLDFTSIGERKRTAMRERELNAPFAPGLYRDVVPVTRGPDGRLRFDGEGEAIDWVVRMARVPKGNFLDEIAGRGDLSPALMDALADTVAAMHAALPRADRPDPGAVLRDVALGNGRAALDAGLDPDRVRLWLELIVPAIAKQSNHLKARNAAGFVRRAHGDLHLGNLCLWPDAGGTLRPVPFDALEFDEDLATIDVGYDLAFLLMDLEHSVGRAGANRVLNRYVARNGDVGLLAPLPAFMSLRAMVRAHVEASRFHPAPSLAYLDQALAVIKPAPARVIAIGGLPGTGKSTLARALAPEIGAAPGALILRSDEIRKRQHGIAPEARLPDVAYTAAASRRVLGELRAQVAATATAGHGVIADATFMNPEDRNAVRNAAGAVPFLGLWLEAPLATLEARVASRTGDASDAGIHVLRRAAQADLGAIDWLRLDATDRTAALEVARGAVRAMRGPC